MTITSIRESTVYGLVEYEATALATTVAALLCEEQRMGSFGVGANACVGQFLDGGCCIAAAICAIVLRHRGHRATIAGGPSFRDPRPGEIRHWWARTPCGWNLDPTWGQFRWSVMPIATRQHELRTIEVYELDTFLSWRGHRSLPGEHQDVVRRVCKRITGADIQPF